MALIGRHFIDTSAAARMANPLVRGRFEPLISACVVARCAMLDAEALCSARSPDDYEEIRDRRRTAYNEYLPTDDEHLQRAFAAQRELAATGRHRAIGTVDLLSAVLAGEHDLT